MRTADNKTNVKQNKLFAPKLIIIKTAIGMPCIAVNLTYCVQIFKYFIV